MKCDEDNKYHCICQNCKYHELDELAFDNPQSICTKKCKTVEKWFYCNDDFEYSYEYVISVLQELDKANKVIDDLEKWLDKELEDNEVIQLDPYANGYQYRNSCQKEKYINNILNKIKELKGED